MNTIAIDSTIYRGAEIYAREHNIKVQDFIESAILTAVGASKCGTRLKPEEELSPQVRNLIGIASGAEDSSIDGKEERMQYLAEKQ